MILEAIFPILGEGTKTITISSLGSFTVRDSSPDLKSKNIPLKVSGQDASKADPSDFSNVRFPKKDELKPFDVDDGVHLSAEDGSTAVIDFKLYNSFVASGTSWYYLEDYLNYFALSRVWRIKRWKLLDYS